MKRADCERVRDAAPELALGVLSGTERAETLAHLSRCADCQREVARLTEAADIVLLVAPQQEPASGFETRVVSAMEARAAGLPTIAPAASWRRRLLAAAVVLIALAGGMVLGRVTGGDDSADLLASAELRDGDGEAIGQVFVYEGQPAWLYMRYKGMPEGVEYDWEVVLDDGKVHRDDARWLDDTEGDWGSSLDVDPEHLRAIRLVARNDADGWSCTAVFDDA